MHVFNCVSQMQSFQGNHCYLISLMCHLHSCGARLDVGTHKTKYHNPCACKPRIINPQHACTTRVTVVVSVCVCVQYLTSVCPENAMYSAGNEGGKHVAFSLKPMHCRDRMPPPFILCMHACIHTYITQMHIIMYIRTQIWWNARMPFTHVSHLQLLLHKLAHCQYNRYALTNKPN